MRDLGCYADVINSFVFSSRIGSPAVILSQYRTECVGIRIFVGEISDRFKSSRMSSTKTRKDIHSPGQIFSKHTQAIFYNYKEKPVQRMVRCQHHYTDTELPLSILLVLISYMNLSQLDFDYACGRTTPSVACIVQPGSSGGFQKVSITGIMNHAALEP